MINRLTRYIIIEQIKPFLFFLSVMAGIIWLVKSLPSLEYIIEYNQPVTIFAQVITYILPSVLLIVVPFAALAATSFTINRLLSEAELITVMNSGLSNFQLFRPFFIFSILISIFLFLLVFIIAPASQKNLREIMHVAGNNLDKQIMQVKKHYSPTPDISMYIGGLNEDNELANILITDDRQENMSITYSAATGNMLINDPHIDLHLRNGVMQSFNKIENSLILTNFGFLELNIADSLKSDHSLKFGPSEMSPTQMLKKAKNLKNSMAKKYLAEAHLRIVLIFTPISLCIFSFSCFLLWGYSRRGYTFLIFLIFFVALIMQSSTFASKSLFLSEKTYWQTIYLPTILTFVFGLLSIKRLSTNLNIIPFRKKLTSE